MTSKIYKITNKINDKVYIGYTKRSLEERFNEHCKEKIDHCKMKIVRAIKKYGKDNFTIELIEESDDDNYIHKVREAYWINFFNSTDDTFGYNLAHGGEGGDTLSNHPNLDKIKEKMRKSSKHRSGWHFTKEQLEKLSKSHMGNKGHIPTEEERKMMSERIKGSNNPMYGKHRSEKEKEYLKEINKGKVYWNNGVINKKSKKCPGEGWVRGMLVTEESKKLRSKVHSGRPSAFKGKTHTDETKRILSELHKGIFKGANNPSAKTIEAISPEGEVFIIKGQIREFCKLHQISYSLYRKYKNTGPCPCSKYISKENIVAKNTEGWIFNSLD